MKRTPAQRRKRKASRYRRNQSKKGFLFWYNNTIEEMNKYALSALGIPKEFLYQGAGKSELTRCIDILSQDSSWCVAEHHGEHHLDGCHGPLGTKDELTCIACRKTAIAIKLGLMG